MQRTYCGIMNYDHDIRVLRHFVQHSCELGQLHFKGVELLAEA